MVQILFNESKLKKFSVISNTGNKISSNTDLNGLIELMTRSNLIRITFPCNLYRLETHFYITKLGYARVYLFVLILLQNIDCGYLLEPPQGGMYPQSMF